MGAEVARSEDLACQLKEQVARSEDLVRQITEWKQADAELRRQLKEQVARSEDLARQIGAYQATLCGRLATWWGSFFP